MGNNIRDEYEKKGREKLLTVFPTIKWEFTKDPYDIYDAYTLHNNKQVIAEIKTRDIKSADYTTALLELQKFNSLMTLDADSVLYVSHYSDNVTATWNLSTLSNEDIKIDSFYMNRATCSGDEKVEKQVIKLDLKHADKRTTSTGKPIK